MPAIHEQVQVLTHRYDVGGHCHVTTPLAHGGRAILVDHKRGRARSQRNHGLVVGVVAAVCIGHQESSVERGNEFCGIGGRNRSGMAVGAASWDSAT